jgi:hypothetical protein
MKAVSGERLSHLSVLQDLPCSTQSSLAAARAKDLRRLLIDEARYSIRADFREVRLDAITPDKAGLRERPERQG